MRTILNSILDLVTRLSKLVHKKLPWYLLGYFVYSTLLLLIAFLIYGFNKGVFMQVAQGFGISILAAVLIFLVGLLTFKTKRGWRYKSTVFFSVLWFIVWVIAIGCYLFVRINIEAFVYCSGIIALLYAQALAEKKKPTKNTRGQFSCVDEN